MNLKNKSIVNLILIFIFLLGCSKGGKDVSYLKSIKGFDNYNSDKEINLALDGLFINFSRLGTEEKNQVANSLIKFTISREKSLFNNGGFDKINPVDSTIIIDDGLFLKVSNFIKIDTFCNKLLNENYH